MPPSAIYDRTDRIRTLINAPRKQSILLARRGDWLKLCSSLDVIGDTDLALYSYLSDSFPSTEGARYLVVYGIVQILYVQQDAIKNLLDAIEIKINPTEYPRLSRIRDIRAASIGHPTKKASKGGASYHFITRATLRRTGFMLLSNRPDGSTQWEGIVIPDLVAQQREDVEIILRRIITILEEDEERHRQEFRTERLENLLPHVLSYHFQKINEATAGTITPATAALGRVNVQMIRDTLNGFGVAMRRRGLDEAYRVNESLADILYPLTEIDEFLQAVEQGRQPRLNERLAYICSFFAESRVEALQSMAREIDGQYVKSAEDERPKPTA